MTGVKLEVSKRTNGDYENVYFNRRLVLEDGADNHEAATQDAITPF